LKKLAGNRDIEDSLERLDKLTQEEARMASAELLKMTHSVDGKVMGVDDRVKGVRGEGCWQQGKMSVTTCKVLATRFKMSTIGYKTLAKIFHQSPRRR
jgi:hypothetical protein